jgi:putative hydroxymethylpyrimidine transporter CytX
VAILSELELRTPDEWGIEPVPAERRRLRSYDFAVLWGDLAVSLLVIVAGSLLVPGLSTQTALLVIVLGTLSGAGLLVLAGMISTWTGVPSMVSLRAALGLRGSYAPSVLNVIQLLGWAALETIVMAKLARGLSDHYLGFSGYYFWLLGFGILGTVMAVGGPLAVVRTWMQKFGVWIVLATSLWLTFHLFDAYDFGAIWRQDGAGGFPNFWQGLDLVIALPVSWLPLVGDYSRFASRASSAAIGTYIGYSIANIWFFALGALYVQALATDPGGLINGDAFVNMLVPLTLGWLALIALLAGETDEVFANIYSTSVSVQNLLPSLPRRYIAIGVGVIVMVLAISLDLVEYETFLLLIGGFFVPLFGILFSDYFFVRGGRYEVDQLFDAGGRYWYGGGVNIAAIGVWLLGFLIYVHAAQPPFLLDNTIVGDDLDFVSWAPDFVGHIGGTIPALVFSVVAYWLAAKVGLGAGRSEARV